MEDVNPVGWFDIYVNDIDKSQKFYEGVLGMSLSSMGDPSDDTITMLAFNCNFNSYGATGALVQSVSGKPGMGGTVIYFSCEDCVEEENRVEKFGGKIIQSKFSIGEFGFISLASDIDGNVIGFHSKI